MKDFFIYALIICGTLCSCQDIEEPVYNVPIVETHAAENIGTTTVRLTGKFSGTYDYSLGHRIGFLLSTSADFIDYRYISASRTLGSSYYYHADIEQLPPGLTYYYTLRASMGEEYYGYKLYGDTVKFTTKEKPMTVGEAVDLGLSVKWANCNVGADSPDEYGYYYAWGETSIKIMYNEENNITWNKDLGDIAGDSRYDAARANWRGNWRLPTKTEWEELVKKCKWEWTWRGYKVVGPNGNSIFLPVSGKHYLDYLFPDSYYQGSDGFYWSSTPYCIKNWRGDNEWNAYQLEFDRFDYNIWDINLSTKCKRCEGLSIRPVCEKETIVAVDLGLSVKWANCNMGADSPEDYGDYFAWGEKSTKSEYTEENSLTYGKNLSDIASDSRYDVARAHLGGSWRIPTKAEFEELNKKCTWTWTTKGGVNGMKVTGPNGNCIFLPASGFCSGTSFYSAGKFGHYWSSTPYESDNTRTAYSLCLYSDGRYVGSSFRDNGISVRPVCE